MDATPMLADDWAVIVHRSFAEQAGPVPGNGPYVTLGVFVGEDAEARARSVVASMEQLTPAGVGPLCWAWSGADILADRQRRASPDGGSTS